MDSSELESKTWFPRPLGESAPNGISIGSHVNTCTGYDMHNSTHYSVFDFIFPYFFVSAWACARLSWPSRQLLSAR